MSFNVKIRQNTNEYLRPIEHCFFDNSISGSDYNLEKLVASASEVTQINESNFTFDLSIVNKLRTDEYSNFYDFNQRCIVANYVYTFADNLYYIRYNAAGGASTLTTTYLIYNPYFLNGNVILRFLKTLPKEDDPIGNTYSTDCHYRICQPYLGYTNPEQWQITNGTGYSTVYTFTDFSTLYSNNYIISEYSFEYSIAIPSAGTAYGQTVLTLEYGTSTLTVNAQEIIYYDATNDVLTTTAPTDGWRVALAWGSFGSSVASTATAVRKYNGGITIYDPNLKITQVQVQGYIGGTTTSTTTYIKQLKSVITLFNGELKPIL